jgi:pimeloyl-ACP methyl ester carboxylesterase
MAEQQVAPGRSRRRGAALEDAILQAAWDEVTSAGYGKLTFEGVAARAGTARSVIYRRWPNRASLVRAAMRHHLGSLADDVPDTGDLREDVLHVLRRLRATFEEVGPDVIHGLAAERADLPQDVFAVTPGVITAILRRAAERGEVQAERITPRIAAVPGTLLRHEVIYPHGDITDAGLAGIVDEIFLPLVVTDGVLTMTTTPPTGSLPVPGASLYYEMRGSGPLLLLIQGGAGDADTAAPLVDLLSHNFMVLTYDRRGQVRSPIEDRSQRVDIETHSTDVQLLLTALTKEPAYVFSSSVGAMIGLDLALRYSSQVRTLVAHEPPLWQLLPEEEQQQLTNLSELYQQQGPAAIRAFAASLGLDHGGTEGATPPSPGAIANRKLFLEQDAPAVGRYTIDIAALKETAVRIVVAAGEDSRQYFPHECAAKLADVLGTKLVEFPGGHASYAGNEPQAFGRQLEDLLLKN